MISAPVCGEVARALLAEGCQLDSVRKLGRVSRARDMERLKVQETPLLQHLVPYGFKIPVPHGTSARRQVRYVPGRLETLHRNFSQTRIHRLQRLGPGEPRAAQPLAIYSGPVVRVGRR